MRRVYVQGALCLFSWLVGCRSVGPGSALTSTIPLGTGSEHLVYLGDASGKSCQATLLYVIPLESDSSIHEAKLAALRDARERYQQQAFALMDVSIDYENVSYVVYEKKCTWVRGKALGLAARSTPHEKAAEPQK